LIKRHESGTDLQKKRVNGRARRKRLSAEKKEANESLIGRGTTSQIESGALAWRPWKEKVS